MKPTKIKWSKIITNILLLLVVLFTAFLILFRISNIAEDKNTGQTPEFSQPPTIKDDDISGKIQIIEKLEIVSPSNSYDISEAPYGLENYKKDSKRLALYGDFKYAALNIEVELPSEQEHFISISLGSFSSVYNAVRKSINGLDISQSKENGGVFDKNNPVKKTINLLDELTFASSSQEFLSTGAKSKLVKLWEYVQPQPPAPSVNRLLIAPFNKDGNYQGTIKKIEFEYSCNDFENNTCEAALCNAEELTTVCIQREFGDKAMNEWMNEYYNAE